MSGNNTKKNNTMKKKYKVGVDTYNIPEDQVDAFLKRYPNAKEVSTQNANKPTAKSSQSDSNVDKDGKDAYVARPGEITPEGLNPSSLWTKEELAKKYKDMGIDYDKLTDAEAQAQLYDKADPYHKSYMWGSIGNTKKGLATAQGAKFDKWRPKANEKFKQYKERLTKEGHTPESLNKELEPYKSSFADSYRGLREATLLTPEKEAIAEEVEKADVNNKLKNAFKATDPNFQQIQPEHDPWWLQDIVKTAGATGDFFRVKKYAPWQATPGVTLPEPTFYDPTRELAASAEMANIGTQGAATFNNPQAFAANFSAIQGQAAKNAADIMGKYNNMNVGVANDFANQNASIMNQAAANRAGLATQLSDKYTIMNQQFDNSKNQARQNLRQSYIDAVTNKNYTANLNDLYDQYKIDPSTGGRIKWTNGRPITPEDTSQQDLFTKFSELRQKLPKDVSDEFILKMITGTDKEKAGNQMYDKSALGYPGAGG